MTFYQFHNESGESFGSYETFTLFSDIDWYWQACFPSCLPDGEMSGPFDSEAEARADADPWMPEEKQ
jgi:hypothetical protein